MENKFGAIYEIITLVVLIIGGVLLIIYRKQFLVLQKKYFSKHKDFLNQKMLHGLESKSEKSFYLLAIIVGLIFIATGVIKLSSFLFL